MNACSSWCGYCGMCTTDGHDAHGYTKQQIAEYIRRHDAAKEKAAVGAAAQNRSDTNMTRLTQEALRAEIEQHRPDRSALNKEMLDIEADIANAIRLAMANHSDTALLTLRFAQAAFELMPRELSHGYESGLFGDISNWLLEMAEQRHGDARRDLQEIARSFIHACDRALDETGRAQ